VARPRSYRVEAVVLRRVAFGEADRVLVLFTRERGKQAVVAKGIRRITSRMAGHLELFTRADIQLAKGANLDVVTQADTLDAFRHLREDLDRTSTAYYVVELADALTEEGEEHQELFELLTATFRALETTESSRLVAAHYTLRLLDVSGFRPVLQRCVACDEELQPGRNAFSPFLGGALCPRCAPAEPTARPIPSDVLKVLRNLQRAGLPGTANFRVPEVVLRDVEQTLRELVERHTERRLRSPDLLARLRVDDAPLARAAPPAVYDPEPDETSRTPPPPPPHKDEGETAMPAPVG
jgi:DNA repair protein RecO (recombination protein O)